MTEQEKAAGVLDAPEAAKQKTDRVIIVGNIGRCNSGDSMLTAMQAAGLAPAKAIDLIPDGKLRRYRVEGDKPGSANGWYVLHEHPVLAGAFGSWKTGHSHNWREARGRPPTHQEREQLRQAMQAAQAARAAEQAAAQEQARARAGRLWSRAIPATNDHPYLVKKQVPAIGIRQLGRQLLIPMRDAHGTLHSLQLISADDGPRSKIFLPGGRKAGCYFAIGRPRNALLLCEGYATAATVFCATGEATAVAFDAGNLTRVACALRAKFPRIKIIICADDDAGTPGNPGVTQAQKAAQAVGGAVVIPSFAGGCHV